MDSALLLRGGGAVALFVAWFTLLAKSERLYALLPGPEMSSVAPHHSLSRLAEDAAVLPITILIVEVAAAIMAGLNVHPRAFWLFAIVPGLFFVFLFLGSMPAIQTARLTNSVHQQLASLQGGRFDEVSVPVSLQGVHYKATIRQRVDFADGTWMALTHPAEKWGGDRVIVWSNARGAGRPNEHPSQVWYRPLSDQDHDDIAVALRALQLGANSEALERIQGVVLADQELTVVAKPHRNVRDARNLLWLGRALRKQLLQESGQEP